jgi:hypothetical protein
MNKIPNPQQRPDLYDDFDYPARPEDQTGVQVPDRIKKLVEARQQQKPAKE